jgi:hypothetical protein
MPGYNVKILPFTLSHTRASFTYKKKLPCGQKTVLCGAVRPNSYVPTATRNFITVKDICQYKNKYKQYKRCFERVIIILSLTCWVWCCIIISN